MSAAARASEGSGKVGPMTASLTLAPTADPRVFVDPDGRRLSPPADWACLPPGDAGLTRRVKAAGPSWAVLEKRGRKVFSRGLWAPADQIEQARAALEAERATDAYARRRAADLDRRDRTQAAYVVTFAQQVRGFLRFAPRWTALAEHVAARVAAHATPVGSGTVARTERIPVDERAEAAVIAWMRHQTTAYDSMTIARVAGRRREVRRELAQLSRAVLDLHRRDAPHAPHGCSLCTAAARAPVAAEPDAPRSSGRPPRRRARHPRRRRARRDRPLSRADSDLRSRRPPGKVRSPRVGRLSRRGEAARVAGWQLSGRCRRVWWC